MRRRFPLLLKKRGRRRTGSPALARVGEFLYHAMFIGAGVIGLWWSLTDVLLPEWRLAEEARGFTLATCKVVGKRVAVRPGLAEPEYCAELEVEFSPNERDAIQVWTRHGVGRDTPSGSEAAAALERRQVGELLPCWFDPEDPRRVLLSVRRRWWPWVVLTVPISMIAIGAFGLVRSLASSGTSAERRSARLTHGLDLSSIDAAAPRPTLASGLPPIDPAGDSPGTARPHRLAMDGANDWRVAGMATLCLVWNVLVALFAYQIGVGYLSSGVRLLVAAVVAGPLALIGWRMTRSTWRDAGGGGGGGATRLELDRMPLVLGDRVSATLLQSGPVRLRSIDITLACSEIATFRQGTDTRTATVEVVRIPVVQRRRVEIDPEQPLRIDFEIEIPAAGPHSFVSANNEVRWSIEVQLWPIGRDPRQRRFPLHVYPPAPAPTVRRPEPAEAKA